MTTPFIIEVEHLAKRFGHVEAVKDVSLQIRKGEVFGFLGANGSGKTTTLRMLCGLLTPDHGKGQCLGFDILKQSSDIKRRIGYMTQRFSFYEELSIEENLHFIAKMYHLKNRKEKVKHILQQFDFYNKREVLTGTLSGGMKQRLALIACLLHEPDLLLLDEPTAGVDPKSRRDFWDEIHLLSQQGITTLVSTHYMDEAERCTRLAYMSFGNVLIQGSIDEVIEKGNLTTYEVQSADLYALGERLRNTQGVDQVILFGSTLHVSAKKGTNFEQVIDPFKQMAHTQWKAIDTTLEDVFINLMQKEETT